MSASALPPLTERLPVELLERIFLFTPTQDILRLSLVRNITEVPRIRAFAEYGNLKVNHTCHSLVRNSPWIRYEIDLFGAGLKHNPRTEATLTDCCTALGAYRRKWETLDLAEKHSKVFPISGIHKAVAVSGTYGILWSNSVKFFTLGSVSRRIPMKEWGVSFKDFRAQMFTFYPQANIMAVVEGAAGT